MFPFTTLLRRFNKKASLDLSINAVVVLILAIALLGVGLFFINSIFGGLIEDVTKIKTKLSTEELDQLRNSKEKVQFLDTRIILSQTKETVAFAAHNNENTENIYTTQVSCEDQIGGQIDLSAINNGFDVVKKIKLKPDETAVRDLVIEFPPSAPSGLLVYCSMTLKKEGSDVIYAEQDFEIEYKKG